MPSLEQLLDLQESITELAHINGSQNTDVVTQARTVQSYAFMVIQELTELSRELGDKPWKPIPPETTREKVLKEVGDFLAMAFQIVNLARERHGLSSKEIVEAYNSVSELNIARFTGKVEDYRL